MVFGHKDLKQHFQELKKALNLPLDEQEKAVKNFQRELRQRMKILDVVAENFLKAGLITQKTKSNLEDAKNAFVALDVNCQIYLDKKTKQSFIDFVSLSENNRLIEYSNEKINLLEKSLDQEDARLKTIICCIHEILHKLEETK